jgi:ABC-2 type transport system permease protein
MTFTVLPTRGVFASEWTKLRSVRSTYLTMFGAAAGALLIGLLVIHSNVSSWPHKSVGERANFDPVSASLIGFAIVQLAFGVLGVLAISSEYGTGMIRTTFAAVPRRRSVLAAKVAVTGVLTLAIGEVLVFITFFLGQLMLSARHLNVTLGDPHVLRAVSGAGFYLAVLSLVGLGLGAIIRHTAGAIATLFGLTLILPQLIRALPSPWNDDIGKWTLNNAVQSIVTTAHPDPTLPSVPMALLVCVTYVAVALGAAGFLITRRDA